MVNKIDHIGIAVDNLDEAITTYEKLFGLKCEGIEIIEEQKVRVAFFNIGDTKIELLESTSPDGPVAKYINKHGLGIQHIAFATTDIQNAIENVKISGASMLDDKPRYGAGGSEIAFIHPNSTRGTLIELSERCSKKK